MARTADVCRKHGIRGGTFYKWKSKFGGMLRSLEDEKTDIGA